MSAARKASESSCFTHATFAAPRTRVWDGLLFYEQIARRAPLLLRLLLPSPIRIEGRHAEVGDEARCLYEEGSLLKRVTLVDPRRRYGFEVVQQSLALGGGMRLAGGGYTLRELPDGRTEVTLETRYRSPWRPRWLWAPLEAAVCHRFHRHVLGEMRRHVLGTPRPERRSPRRLSSPSASRGSRAGPRRARG